MSEGRAAGEPVGGRGATSSRPGAGRARERRTMQRPAGGGPSMVRSTVRLSRQARWLTRMSNGGASGLFQLPATGSDVRKVYDDAPPAPRTGWPTVTRTRSPAANGSSGVKTTPRIARSGRSRPVWRPLRVPATARVRRSPAAAPTMVIDEAGDAWRNAGPG